MNPPPKWLTATLAGVVTVHFVADTFKHPTGPDVSGPPRAALMGGSTGTAGPSVTINAITGGEYRTSPPLDRFSKRARIAYGKTGRGPPLTQRST